ncbi:isovaleryl-CoA dehydrogenase [Mangrovimicrobium sediminis]|uniref:Isovaleryl-CoA dehydrogenase n=1 Tax=Mangrovimicrobium sediminis TaxID=2562682 RepID=A0A4Z0LYB6_9GAMM|nr:isovaleryl-CoA dehydrogenase [Haliea sp. SAOS-164]TGD72279.1 isovaleryl-CoA dehydrogenase [Haliea sp. SAOS-164]
MTDPSQFATHAVENQPGALRDYNAWTSDAPLREAVAREGAGWAVSHLHEYGRLVGGELVELGFAANRHRPVLHSYDAHGRRIDEVEFHPAYHRIMQLAMQHGVHSYAWRNVHRESAHVARAALIYLGSQADAGSACPLSMTYAAIPALRHAGDWAAPWVEKLTAQDYDPRALPMADKRACTIGMGMTEKQGGSDVRANTTRAVTQPDGSYALVGHKWFFSAPMSDAHLVLAQADAGLTCFLVPRLLADGTRNAVAIQRLKDKLGDWSNASSEVEFQGAHALRVGAEGRGVATILEMVALTRLDCITCSAALMRQAVVQAVHHAGQRRVFGKLLIDQPLMRNVLADLALEAEAATALAMRVARAIDAAPRDPREAAFARIATALGKFWVCKRAPGQVNEAQECLGGIGYVEDTIMPRLYRQAPLNSIWEGAGNVQCLDVLRALRREPETREALFEVLGRAGGQQRDLDLAVARLAADFDRPETLEVRSRYVVERAAKALQAAVLLSGEQPAIAEIFCRHRLGEEGAASYGTLAADAPFDLLIARATALSEG